MSDWRESQETLVHHSRIKVPYTWSIGETGTRFVRALRDEQKILGNKCPDTGYVYCPPKRNSAKSLKPVTDWVTLGNSGTVTAFTRRHYETEAAPGAPEIYALIKLEGADQALPHFLAEVDFKDVKIGMKVEAVFKEEREGHILDIKYFKPA